MKTNKCIAPACKAEAVLWKGHLHPVPILNYHQAIKAGFCQAHICMESTGDTHPECYGTWKPEFGIQKSAEDFSLHTNGKVHLEI